MKTIRFIIVYFFISSAFVVAQNPDGISSKALEKHVTTIKKHLDLDRWTVEATPESIIIKSKFKVDLQRKDHLFGQLPKSITYRIELLFKKELSKVEYIKLAKKRTEYAAILNYGAKTEAENSAAIKFLEENTLPRYGSIGAYSVYCVTSESIITYLERGETYSEVKAALATIDRVFWARGLTHFKN